MNKVVIARVLSIGFDSDLKDMLSEDEYKSLVQSQEYIANNPTWTHNAISYSMIDAEKILAKSLKRLHPKLLVQEELCKHVWFQYALKHVAIGSSYCQHGLEDVSGIKAYLA